MPTRKIKIKRSLTKNAPKIFKIVGLVGLIGAPVLSVYSTVKAVRACDKRKEELQVEKLPVGEIVKTSWKYYIPVISLMGASTASMVNGENMSSKRMDVLSSAYNAAERTLADYKEEARKKLGDKEANELARNVYGQQANQIREDIPNVLIQGYENGGTLFYEPITGTFFYSTRNKVDRAFNELSAQMIREDYVNLGDLFYLLGLKQVEACRLVGWSSMRVKTIEPEYSWFGIEETTTPYVIMGYEYFPTPDYVD